MTRSSKKRLNQRKTRTWHFFLTDVLSVRLRIFLLRVWSFLRQRVTLMVLPNVHGRVFNLRLSVFSLFVSGIFFVLVIVGFFSFSALYWRGRQDLAQQKRAYNESQADLSLLREGLDELYNHVKEFQQVLDTALSSVNIDKNVASWNHDQHEQEYGGDFGDFGDLRVISQRFSQDIGRLEEIQTSLTQSVEPLQALSEIFKNQQVLLGDLPSLWPVRNSLGVVTLTFGPAREPFTRRWYLHKGFDIAYTPGVPIVATANGVVTKVEYSPTGFGHWVLVRHKYGLSTLYAHMGSSSVLKGQRVSRGDVLGTLGGTGYATGPHLHYEVHVGSQVVDPEVYLNISRSVQRTR